MVDITSLKARLARLRLGSEFEDKHPELRDPASDSLEKKRGKKKQKKASKDPYSEYTKNTGGKRKKNNKLTRSDQKRGKKDNDKVKGSHSGRNKRQEGSTQEYSGFGEYVKNTGDRRKKKNKLTRSDQKRGKEEYHFEDYLGKKYKKKKGKKVNLSRDDSLHLQGS